jgi:hypothetical protein
VEQAYPGKETVEVQAFERAMVAVAAAVVLESLALTGVGRTVETGAPDSPQGSLGGRSFSLGAAVVLEIFRRLISRAVAVMAAAVPRGTQPNPVQRILVVVAAAVRTTG